MSFATMPMGDETPRATAPAGDYVLILTCPDRPGVVHAVSGFLVRHGGNIIESQQFGDRLTGRFFMRVGFVVPGTGTEQIGVDELRRDFADVAARFDMTFELWDGPGAVPHLDHGVQAPALPQRPAVPLQHRVPADRDPRRGVQPPRRRAAGPGPRPGVRARAGDAGDQATRRGPAPRAGREARRPPRGARALHAGAVRRTCRPSSRAGRSTSTTRSCRASRARSPTTRLSTAG